MEIIDCQQAPLRMKSTLNPNSIPFDPQLNEKHNNQSRICNELYAEIQSNSSRNLLLFQFKNAYNKLPDGNERNYFDENYQNIVSNRLDVFKLLP